MTRLSIVVPMYNEEDSVGPLYDAITAALDHVLPSYELLLVDDGSSDASVERAAALVERDPRVQVIKFRRNFGQTAAMAAGIDHASGEIVITMDGDLQNDPVDIPRLVALIDQGYDIVIGWRHKRKDDAARVVISKIANKIIARVMGVAVKDSGCSLKAYRAELIKSIPMHSEMHRFLPALSQLAGARLAQIEVNHHPRQFGSSKYGFSRIFKVAIDIISIRALLSYSAKPFTWHATLSALSLMLSVAALLWYNLPWVGAPVVGAGISFLLFSLTMFVGAWGLIGLLFAVIEPEVGKFAALSATLARDIEWGGENAQ